MPTFPGSRGRSSTTWPERVSCREIVRTERDLSPSRPAVRVALRRRCRRWRRCRRRSGRCPSRYLGAEPGFDATYHVRLGDIGHTWEVRCTTHGARVRAGATGRRRRRRDRHRRRDLAAPAPRASSPASRRSRSACSTPAATSTSRSASRACSASPTAARRCCASTTSRWCAAAAVSTLTMGEGPDVLLLHGLGAHQDLVLRHRGGAEPAATASTRSTCRASAARASPRCARTTRPSSPAPCSGRWTRWGSSARTWSATRWAAASRSRSA